MLSSAGEKRCAGMMSIGRDLERIEKGEGGREGWLRGSPTLV
jgi:hypothetical protein